MSAGVSTGKKGDQDVELNLAPIIDCFTVLITYMLVSASFITLGTLDISVATAAGEETPQEKVPAVSLAIHLGSAQEIVLEVRGQENREFRIGPKADGSQDLERLVREIEALQGRFPGIDGALLTADDSVRYREVVRTVESTRSRLPKIALSSIDEGV